MTIDKPSLGNELADPAVRAWIQERSDADLGRIGRIYGERRRTGVLSGDLSTDRVYEPSEYRRRVKYYALAALSAKWGLEIAHAERVSARVGHRCDDDPPGATAFTRYRLTDAFVERLREVFVPNDITLFSERGRKGARS